MPNKSVVHDKVSHFTQHQIRVPIRYSEGSLFRRVIIPKKKIRVINPKGFYSEGSLFRKEHEDHYPEGSLFRKYFDGHYSEGSLFRK